MIVLDRKLEWQGVAMNDTDQPGVAERLPVQTECQFCDFKGTALEGVKHRQETQHLICLAAKTEPPATPVQPCVLDPRSSSWPKDFCKTHSRPMSHCEQEREDVLGGGRPTMTDKLQQKLERSRENVEVVNAMAEGGGEVELQAKVDFHCGVCGVETPIAPDPPEKAICGKCCGESDEGHDYQYDRHRQGHYCFRCDEEVPIDYFDMV